MQAKSRQAERSEVTREALLSAARTLFAERGYADTPTEEVVRRAAVTRGALYHHFKNKEELFAAVVEQIQQEITARSAQAISASQDLWSGLLAGCDAFLDACLDPAVQRIALIDGPAVLGWDRHRELDAKHGLGLVRAGVEAAMAEGLIAPGPPEPLAHVLLGGLSEGAMLIARAEDVNKARREVGMSVKTLLAGLRTG